MLTVLIAVVGLSAFPVENGETALGDEWLRAPLAGIVDALQGPLPDWLGDALRVYVGLTGALVLLAAATTSISGFTRLAHSLGEHGQLPRSFGRLNRRTLVSPQAIVAAAAISAALAIATSVARRRRRLPREPLLVRHPARVRGRAARRAAPPRHRAGARRGRSARRSPAPLIGVPLAIGVWVLALVTHPGARYAGPAWLALGLVVYLLVRAGTSTPACCRVPAPVEELPPGADFRRILVPMKLGPIGEEMVATAVALAKEREAEAIALYVIRVPLEKPLDAPMHEKEEQAAASLAEAVLLGEEHGVRVEPVKRARPLDRPGDRRAGGGARHRPDRARLLAALAAPVGLLLADGRLRPPATRRARCSSSPSRRASSRRSSQLGWTHEADGDRLRPSGIRGGT